MNPFFYSLISFVIALFFLLMGTISLLIPWLPGVKNSFVTFLLHNSIALSLFGISLVAIGVFMAINIILATKNRYYKFNIGPHIVKVDETLIRKYLETYFNDFFSEKETPCQVIIKNNALHITVDLPAVPQAQRDVVIEKITEDLKNLLSRQIGYNSTYYLSLSFQQKKQKEAE